MNVDCAREEREEEDQMNVTYCRTSSGHSVAQERSIAPYFIRLRAMQDGRLATGQSQVTFLIYSVEIRLYLQPASDLPPKYEDIFDGAGVTNYGASLSEDPPPPAYGDCLTSRPDRY